MLSQRRGLRFVGGDAFDDDVGGDAEEVGGSSSGSHVGNGGFADGEGGSIERVGADGEVGFSSLFVKLVAVDADDGVAMVAVGGAVFGWEIGELVGVRMVVIEDYELGGKVGEGGIFGGLVGGRGRGEDSEMDGDVVEGVVLERLGGDVHYDVSGAVFEGLGEVFVKFGGGDGSVGVVENEGGGMIAREKDFVDEMGDGVFALIASDGDDLKFFGGIAAEIGGDFGAGFLEFWF